MTQTQKKPKQADQAQDHHHDHGDGCGCGHDHHNDKTVRRQGPKIGRNDKCPCGSGKKYKKCCG